jgi:hypothetical protein
VQRVTPVAGLLAQAGGNLRELEFRRLRALAEAEPADAGALLLSADRFVTAETSLPLAPPERQVLLDRLGLFGVRLGVDLLRRNEVVTASQLADRLVDHSGIAALREVLLTQFSDRRDTLKARSALLALQRLLSSAPVDRGPALAGRLEQIRSGAHEFAELRLLNALRLGEVDLRPEEVEEVERLMGAGGGTIAARLGVPAEAPPDELSRALFAVLARWRQRAENPMSSLAVSAASRVVVRTCEGMYATLAANR